MPDHVSLLSFDALPVHEIDDDTLVCRRLSEQPVRFSVTLPGDAKRESTGLAVIINRRSPPMLLEVGDEEPSRRCFLRHPLEVDDIESEDAELVDLLRREQRSLQGPVCVSTSRDWDDVYGDLFAKSKAQRPFPQLPPPERTAPFVFYTLGIFAYSPEDSVVGHSYISRASRAWPDNSAACVGVSVRGSDRYVGEYSPVKLPGEWFAITPHQYAAFLAWGEVPEGFPQPQNARPAQS